MYALKLMPIGEASGLVLPQEILSTLQVAQGDTVFALETSEGVLLTSYAAHVVEQLEVGHQLMHDFHETFRNLIK